MNTTETLKELLKLAHESMVSKDIEIAELKEQLEEAMTFNVDVVRCLSRIAVVENHNEVPAYIDMSRRCIKTIEAKQAKALEQETFHFNDQDFQPEALKEQEV
jgi:5-bromo-4-chloroindolyl phosphate hydrolysis protein